MDNDMALAAAYAAGAEPPATAFQPQRGPPGGAAPPWGGQGGEEAVMEGELPSVDDLEVAAAAAGVAPVPAVLAELGYTEMGAEHGAGAQAMEASSSGGSSGDDSSSSDDDEADELSLPLVRLELRAVGEDAVAVSLVPSRPTSAAAAGAAMDVDAGAEVAPDSSAEDDDSSSSSSSSSSSDDDDDEAAAAAAASDGEGEPLDIIKDYAGIKKLIADMDADDADGGGGGGDGEPAAALRAEAQLLGGAPLPSLAALEIAADDAVQAAGVVQSMLEGMVVIRAEGGSRALSEGSVLVLGDRSPVGVIEEIFGPVVAPFYALRYAGAQPAPASLVPGCTVYSVDRLADFVLPEALRVRGYDAAEEEAEEAALEAQFSDDEAEAQHRRQLQAKRKEAPDGLPQQGGGRGRGGRGGGGARGGGRGSGRGGGRGGRGQHPQQQAYQQQQQQQQAFYHPHQQQVQSAPAPPPAGRVFSGRLPRQQQGGQQGPHAGFQAHAAAAQFTGMSLQQQQQAQQAQQQQQYYQQAAAPPPRPSGQVLRAQYAVPPGQPHPAAAPMMMGGVVMQPQWHGARPQAYAVPLGAPHGMPGQAPPPQFAPAPPPQQQFAPGFTPALPFPPPPPGQPPQQ